MEQLYISKNLIDMAKEAEEKLKPYFDYAKDVCEFNTQKVLNAFIKNKVAYQDFVEINGYGFLVQMPFGLLCLDCFIAVTQCFPSQARHTTHFNILLE